MRRAARTFDSQYMRVFAPFGAFLLCGVFCSAVVAGRAWLPTVTARAIAPASIASAEGSGDMRASYGVPTVVTEVQPARAAPTAPQRAAPASEVAPPNAPDRGPAGSVQALSPPIAADPGPLSVGEKSQTLLVLMNAARERDSLAPLERDSALDEIALFRARDLVAREYFDHYGPDGSSAFSELAIRGWRYRLAGENLARNNYPGSRTAQAAFDGLMASPGHRDNILEERFGRVGIAAVQSGRLWVYVTVFTD